MAPRIAIDINIDIGIAIPTKSAFLKPKKNSNTKTTITTPNIILLTKSVTWFSVNSDWSFAIETVRFFGKIFSIFFSTIERIFSTARKVFSPDLFLTTNITTGLPFSRAYVVTSFSLNFISAISFSKTELLYDDLTTKFSRSEGEPISPIIRIVFL